MNKEEINALHNEFRRCGKNAKEWMRQCQMMLPRIRDEEVWKKKGFSSIYEYAAKLAGMSHNSVNEALRILDCLKDKPELKKSVEKFGLNNVSPVITIATENTDGFWADKVGTMSVQALKTYVREYRRDGLDVQGQRAQGQDEDMSNTRRAEGLRCEIRREATNCEFCLGDSGDCEVSEEGSNTADDRKTASVYMKLDVKTIERMKKLKGDMEWDEMLNEMLNVYDEAVDTAQKDEIEKPAPVNTGKRYVPREIQKYVTNKTSGLCAYPGCARPYEILHHTKRFAIDATHDPDTIEPMCKAHERLAHNGLIKNEGKMPVEFASDASEVKINWSLRKQPDETSRKYGVDKKVNEHYVPKLE